jgi:hypothetical protein
MIFGLLHETHGFKSGDNIQANVGYTMPNDNFIILCASIKVAGEKNVTLFFPQDTPRSGKTKWTERR